MSSHCSKCGKAYEVSLDLGGGSTRVAKCRVCPVDRIFMICEHCANLEALQRSPCPWCGAKNMWAVERMDLA